MLLAVLGTTISPYLLYSQAEQQLEAQRSKDARARDMELRQARRSRLRNIRRETMIRTALSNAVALSIMIAAAATLHASSQIADSAESLANVLAPIAGGFDRALLGLALISSALLALPPLAGSAAHAVASTVGWPIDARHNRRIALTLVASLALGGALGILLALLRLDPIRVLYWSALVNGTTATPVMVLLVLLSTRHSSVGDLSAHWSLRALSWLATAGMGAAVVARYVFS